MVNVALLVFNSGSQRRCQSFNLINQNMLKKYLDVSVHVGFDHASLLSEPEASSEESPSADEEQAAPSATAAEAETEDAADKTEPTENGVKADGGAEEKGGDGTEKKE